MGHVRTVDTGIDPVCPVMTREVQLESHSPALLRRLGRLDVLLLTLNNIVGSGIFTLPAVLVAAAGAWSFTVLFFTVGLVALMALCTAEVASRYDATGGPMLYANAAFGPTTGFLVASLMYLSRLASFGAIAAIMLDYSAGLWPALGATWARAAVVTVFVAILASINIRGVAYGALASNVLTISKGVPLVLLALSGLWVGGQAIGFPTENSQPAALGGAVLLVFYACMGFEAGTVVAGEAKNPIRDLPLGMLGGVIGAGVLYSLMLWTCLNTVPDLAHSQRPLADAASAIVGPAGARAVSLTAVLSTAATLTLWMMVTPRLLYALAQQGDLPSAFVRVGRVRHTPWVGIVASAVIVWLLTLSGTFVYLATFSAISRLLTYASTCAALIVLRKREGPAPLSIPLGRLCSVVALLCTVAAMVTSTGTAIRDVSIALALTWVGRSILRRRNRLAMAPNSG
jgi:amino acid transporter